MHQHHLLILSGTLLGWSIGSPPDPSLASITFLSCFLLSNFTGEQWFLLLFTFFWSEILSIWTNSLHSWVLFFVSLLSRVGVGCGGHHTHTIECKETKNSTLECKENGQMMRISHHKNVNKNKNPFTPAKIKSKKKKKKKKTIKKMDSREGFGGKIPSVV